MRVVPIFFLVLLVFNACKPGSSGTGNAAVLYDSAYQPAVFSDTGRLQKMASVFPVIDSIVRGYAALHHLPGLVYGIVANGQLVHKGALGFTDIQKKTPATPSSLFRIASMSKSFACMAILKLRDAGKLNLEDPAYAYIPELKGLKYPTLDAPHITIRHLMTHGAGFPEDNPWGDRQLADSDADLMAFIAGQVSFSNPPGVAYEYSNLGFALLGKIITKASGMRYQDYVKREILVPLGMEKTTYEFAEVEPLQLAHGYRWLNNTWNDEALLHDAPDGSWGAMGAMISSVDEFAAYMALHLQAWPPGNTADSGPLKRSSVREMHHPWRWNGFQPNFTFPCGRVCATTTAYGYGLGWMKDCEGRTFINHSGGLPGFGSNWYIMPDYGIGIVSMANRTYAPMRALNLRLLDTLIQLAGLQPRELPPSAILERRKQELLTLLPAWQAAEQSGLFAENFFPDNPIDSLRKHTLALYEKAGKIVSVQGLKPENQLRGSCLLIGEQSDIEIYFTLSPENPALIQAFEAREVPKKPGK